MTSPAYAIAQYLDTAGVGVFAGQAGWAIAVSREPEQPIETITVYDTPGGEPEPDQNMFRPSFQVRIRHDDYLAAFEKAEQIRQLLVLNTPFVIQGVKFIGIYLTSEINSIGRDDNDRHLIVCNYRALVVKSATVST